MLIVHHLNVSQSERIIWLLEELGLTYELRTHLRDPVTRKAPPELRQVHPLGKAPILEDGALVLAESGAIIDYIFATRSEGALSIKPGHSNFPDYIYWFHYANGSLFLQIMLNLVIRGVTDEANASRAFRRQRLERHLDFVEARLGETAYFAGPAFTAADIMMHFPFGTMRQFFDLDLSNRPNVNRWLDRISERPAYQRAMRKAGHSDDPGRP